MALVAVYPWAVSRLAPLEDLIELPESTVPSADTMEGCNGNNVSWSFSDNRRLARAHSEQRESIQRSIDSHVARHLETRGISSARLRVWSKSRRARLTPHLCIRGQRSPTLSRRTREEDIPGPPVDKTVRYRLPLEALSRRRELLVFLQPADDHVALLGR